MLAHAILESGPDTSPRPYDSFVDVCRSRAATQPDAIAYRYLRYIGTDSVEQDAWSYAELDLRAKTIAGRLQRVTEPGDRVLLVYPAGLEFIAAFLGCLYAGAVAVPVYPPLSVKHWPRFAKIAEDCRASAILTADAYHADLARAVRVTAQLASIRCLATETLAGGGSVDWHDPKTKPSDLAFLQYTSGTTGTPKGVMISHGNLLHNQRTIESALCHSRESVGVSWLPLYHDMGLIGAVLQPLYCGFPVILMSPLSFLQEPLRWLKALSDFQGTSSAAPNFAYELCVRRVSEAQKKTLDLSPWRNAFNGAEHVRAATLDRFAGYFADCGFRREALTPGYGMAEATLMVSSALPGRQPSRCDVSAAALERNRCVPWTGGAGDRMTLVGCGQPVDQEVVIVDPATGTVCDPDRIGEIWVRGPNVARGYWGQETKPDTGFNAYTRDTGAGPYFRTGDLGFLHRGEVFVTGRLKELIIIRGRNFYPHDIEAVAQASHPSLRAGRGAAFGVTLEGEEHAVLVQEVKNACGEAVDCEEVIASIRMAVAEQQSLPLHDIVLIKQGQLPMTSSGKIRRRDCCLHYLNDTLARFDRTGRARDETPPVAGACSER